jgi:hypothetical protein
MAVPPPPLFADCVSLLETAYGGASQFHSENHDISLADKKVATDTTVRSTNKNRFLSQSPVFPSATFGTVPFAFCGQFFCHHDAVRHAALPFEL